MLGASFYLVDYNTGVSNIELLRVHFYNKPPLIQKQRRVFLVGFKRLPEKA